MNILHINGAYPLTPIYYELLLQLDKYKEINNIMYVPLENKKHYERKYDINTEHIKIIYSYDFNKIDRLLYYTKIHKILKGLTCSVNLNKMEYIHAHYLFSCGGIAYQLKKIFNINYIVAVRNTDVNVFFKRMVHLRKYGILILNEAVHVIFLSPAYRDFVLKKFIPSHCKKQIADKSIIIPNGISNFWFNNRQKKEDFNKSIVRLLYIGEISRNKNIETTIKAVKLLRETGLNVVFTIVGNGRDKTRIAKIVKRHSSYINLYDWTNDKMDLLKHYRSSDIFIMPSITETFGIVYIEALSQGLPIIYSKGQGVDGYFRQGEVGYSCNPHSSGDVANKIQCIIENYSTIAKHCSDVVNNFFWGKIAAQYRNIYTNSRNKLEK